MIKGVPFMTILIATMMNVNLYFYGFRISYCKEVEPQTIKISPNSKALISIQNMRFPNFKFSRNNPLPLTKDKEMIKNIFQKIVIWVYLEFVILRDISLI